jgi:hypothetical protein
MEAMSRTGISPMTIDNDFFERAIDNQMPEGFDWRPVEDFPEFWELWRKGKDYMKYKGFRVQKSEAGQWQVMLAPTKAYLTCYVAGKET